MLYTMGTNSVEHQNDAIHNGQKIRLTSKTMLCTIGTKFVLHRKRCYTQWAHNSYNIENDVIHNGHKICVTPKTMLYTMGTKFV